MHYSKIKYKPHSSKRNYFRHILLNKYILLIYPMERGGGVGGAVRIAYT
jgi:hypothetical protein